MKNLAVIPARGGSKRIPRKNIRAFAGLPMIAYAIAAARARSIARCSAADSERSGVIVMLPEDEVRVHAPTRIPSTITELDSAAMGGMLSATLVRSR